MLSLILGTPKTAPSGCSAGSEGPIITPLSRSIQHFSQLIKFSKGSLSFAYYVIKQREGGCTWLCLTSYEGRGFGWWLFNQKCFLIHLCFFYFGPIFWSSKHSWYFVVKIKTNWLHKLISEPAPQCLSLWLTWGAAALRQQVRQRLNGLLSCIIPFPYLATLIAPRCTVHCRLTSCNFASAGQWPGNFWQYFLMAKSLSTFCVAFKW